MGRMLAICAFVAGLIPLQVSAGSDPFLGEIITVPYNFCPKGWAPLNGQLLPINQNLPLFSLLGTIYGGDGQRTFALPLAKPVYTLNGAPLIQCIAIIGTFPTRN